MTMYRKGAAMMRAFVSEGNLQNLNVPAVGTSQDSGTRPQPDGSHHSSLTSQYSHSEDSDSIFTGYASDIPSDLDSEDSAESNSAFGLDGDPEDAIDSENGSHVQHDLI